MRLGRERQERLLQIRTRDPEAVVALCGNPNTGKSTLFNALTGLHQHTGNWPGKTVARTEGTFRHRGWRFRLVDLPGTYSLLSSSEEEEVARDFLLSGRPDVTVAVVDATCLERNLNLVLQVAHLAPRLCVCLNLMDEARRDGWTLDVARLERELGAPVVPTVARRGEGLETLKEKILGLASGTIPSFPRPLPLDPELARAVSDLAPRVKEALPDAPAATWLALRLLDGDDEVRGGVERWLDGESAARQRGEAAQEVVR
jgi:ferrous iron transport protein B